MREIKFRFRLKDRKTGEVISVYIRLFNEQNGLMQFPVELDKWEVLSIDEYTGLHDKNGVEIYEGDIIEQPRTDKPFSEKAKTKLVRMVVKWWDGHSHHNYELNKEMMSKNPSWFNEQPHYIAVDIEKETKFVHYAWSEFHDCEVIGNIYENRDMLKEAGAV